MFLRAEKVIKVPHGLAREPLNQGILKMKGLTVVESCTFTKGLKGTMFLEDHLLLFVLEGTYKVIFGSQEYIVRKNEMVLLQKSIRVEYEKSGEEGSDYVLDYMMFFLKEELLTEFINMAYLESNYPSALVPVSVKAVNERLIKYIYSLKPYFKETDNIREGLIKVKLLELLFDVADADEQFIFQFLQLKRSERKSITEVVEQNLTNPVSLNDLAYLSGRSLSAFKRDFQAIYYTTSPVRWIRNRRLDIAKEMLLHTSLSVTDVCFSTGFESVAHFSKVFKERFGVAPSTCKPPLQKPNHKSPLKI
ncbi:MULTISPECIES: AraC family transcriptional regulator [unclassified Paenibacillus]|uniref:AraC family transcriptional regulator n=1 Tax=unclassified Paenibacillus TaxID=185978 RepID=UPI002785BB80|nr:MULTISPECIES: AraC family transcriptional regulator [unclassified Paenibacillus]MDQ0903474.1 AraC-like DNA-binding protein [Paenibacillus sp. V4I7]MDQ0918048.1 AraC-like DNA-binding protein [Paenibacillus sp. V4I5]